MGKASFTATFPDDITNWRTFIIGISDKQQTGFAENSIKAFKPLSANFIAPQFAVAGDEVSLIGKVMNYNSTNVKLTRTFTYNGKQLKQDGLEVKNSKIDTLGIIASPTDSLSFEYTIKRDNGYFDGERRKVPVIKQGVEETKGIFEALNSDTTVNLEFNPAMGPVTFRAEASVLPTLAEESRKLREYKYLCNEQLASKLKGLLAERRIKKFLGEEFKYGKNIQEAIKKLQENRKTNGTWGWWKDTDEELWISLHAVEALLGAQKEGYTVQLDKQKLTDYLVYQLESYHGADKLTCLELLHKLEAKIDYQKYIDIIERENNVLKQKTGFPLSGYDKFRLMLVKQEAGLPVKLDSLFDKQHHTLFGNIYWGDDSYRFFDNSVQLSILAYRIIKADGKHPGQLRKIQGYFLEQRSHGEWRNTYESALILETILPDLLVADKQVKPSAITIKGATTQTINTFPYSATFKPENISVSKTGSLPVYITGSQKFWNNAPQKVSKEFIVDTWFERKKQKVTSLKGGDVVQLKAEVNAKGDADFVMIEIPIPAGCSYESKDQPWGNNEVHREYFKEKVSIFCRKLKQGKYTFTVNLIPRYDGKYTLNPAKAEMMYFPVFYGREGMKRVVVGK
ncbi:alpha-2-macroglobulin family protein [Mucilaginibacter sp. AW1-7]|uniref:alpha-2-macroglobulin family protein n=1 Tax=Mucilaginibacter sp. AW1-7 TaxID=3349874 RepID=UPI003F733985